MPIRRNRPKPENFNRSTELPFQLRLEDFEIAMQDVYDLFYDVNTGLLEKGLERLDDFLRPAIMSGLLSDLLTASVAKHSRTLAQNTYFNGHPDLVVKACIQTMPPKPGRKVLKSKRRAKPAAPWTRTARETNGWLYLFTTSTMSPSLLVKENR
jgi:hypothetical protein